MLLSLLSIELLAWSIGTTNVPLLAGLEIVRQGITRHQGPLADIQLDVVTGVLLGSVVSEGSSHGVRCL